MDTAFKETLDALIELAMPIMLENKFDTSEGADGNCGYAVDLFLDVIDAVAPELCDIGEIVLSSRRRCDLEDNDSFRYDAAFEDMPHDYYIGGPQWDGHCIVRVGNIYIDWTARQFNDASEAPFPLVFELDKAA